MRHLLSLLLLAVLVVGCSDSESARQRKQFVAGCTSAGTSKSLCSCMYEHFETVYTPAQLRDMDVNQRLPDNFVAVTYQAAQKCR